MLGPLCVALSVLDVRTDDASAHAGRPDIWGMLAPVVVREVRDAGASCIAINDSKRVKVSGSAKRHPLEFLERAILCIASCMSRDCACDADVYSMLGTGAQDSSDRARSAGRWYAGQRVGLPLASTPDQIRLASARLRSACEKAGVSFSGVACRVCDEHAFNDEVRKGTLKSEISFARVSELLRSVWDAHAGDASLDEFGPRVVVDRQGGRVSYARHLERAVPGASVEIRLEHPDASVYDLRDADGRRMRVTFAVGADGDHFPTALASMAAKFVRELAMMRFNRYWCERIAELRPTAGYGTDAKRWLCDIEHATTPEERAVLRRMA